MKPPRRLNVGPHLYRVEYDRQACTAASVTGVCLQDNTRILLDPTQSRSSERETLLHEAEHALWHQTELNRTHTDEEEERILWSMTPRRLALMRDNPDFVRYLMAGVK